MYRLPEGPLWREIVLNLFISTQGNLLKYEKEIDRLKNKLKWYAENQEFLDRDANKIKHQDEEIYKLKQKLESVKTEVCVSVCYISFNIINKLYISRWIKSILCLLK